MILRRFSPQLREDIHISLHRIIYLVLLRDILTTAEVGRAISTCTTCA